MIYAQTKLILELMSTSNLKGVRGLVDPKLKIQVPPPQKSNRTRGLFFGTQDDYIDKSPIETSLCQSLRLRVLSSCQ
jgi:hypothetical protein